MLPSTAMADDTNEAEPVSSDDDAKEQVPEKQAPKTQRPHIVLRVLLVVAGGLLIAGFFFFPWLKLETGEISGLQLVIERNPDIRALIGDDAQVWLLGLVPAFGVALIGVGASGFRHSGIVAAILGVLLIGASMVTLVILFFQVTGLGLWLSLLGAFTAIGAGSIAFARSRSQATASSNAGK